jgi:integrase/recombinase XerD
MKTEQALELYGQHLAQQHFAAATIDSKQKALALFVQWMEQKQIGDWRDVTFDDVRGYQAYLAKRRKPNGDLSSKAYQNNLVWTLNDFYSVLHQRGKVLLNPCADLPPLRKPKRLPRGVITADQVTRMLLAPNLHKPYGFRDRAMLELLYSSGLRARELCALSLYDVDFDKRLVRITQGKGRKDRLVPVGRAALTYLSEYIKKVRPVHLAKSRRRESLTRLFLTIQGTPFITKYLGDQVALYRNRVGLPKTVTTHSLRHACATEMLRGGASIRHVQEMLGHAHMSTTQIYTHVVPHDLKRVHANTAPSERRRVIDVPKFQNKGWKDHRNRGFYHH